MGKKTFHKKKDLLFFGLKTVKCPFTQLVHGYLEVSIFLFFCDFFMCIAFHVPLNVK